MTYNSAYVSDRVGLFVTLLTILLLAFGTTACGDNSNEDGDAVADVDEGDVSEDVDPDADNDMTGPDFPDQEVIETDTDDAEEETEEDTTILPDGEDTEEMSTDTLELDRLDPTSGPSSGENVIEARGEGFTENMEVFFGPVRAPAVEYVNSRRINVTVPGGDAGLVDVKVVNENGVDVLEDGYEYVDAIQIENIVPDRFPTTGGVPFTITGTGFTENTAVSIGGRTAIDVVTGSNTSVTGIAPAGTVGLADVRVTNENGSTLVPDAIEYYEPIRVDQIFPGAGPTTGGTTVTITGAGFAGQTTVTIGTKMATVVSNDGTEIVVTTPAAAAGARNVVVASANGTTVVTDGFVYYAPSPGLDIYGVQPASGPSTGGNEVIIQGQGLGEIGSTVTIGGNAATVLAALPGSLRVTAPAGSIGQADVSVTNSNGSDTLIGGYTYLEALTISAVNPTEGPVAGGTNVTITGSGFDAGTSVFFGPLPASNVTVSGPTQITATTPAGSGGSVDVIVREPNQEARLIDGFFYSDVLQVFALQPRRGSQAGNTLVTVAGSGFAPGATVQIDGQAGLNVTVLDSNTLTFVTPPHPPGVVQVDVTLNGTTETSPNTFTYYDPGSSIGGGWGDPVEGNVNITVYEYGSPPGTPVDGAFVMLTVDNGTPFQGIADVNGQITFSADNLQGTQTVTASKQGYSSATVTTIDAENVTIYLQNLDQQMGEPPPGQQPGIISGNITGADKVSLESNPNKIRFSLIVTSQVDPGTPNPDPGTENQITTNNGNGFYRLNSRLGDVAVIGLCGLLDTSSGEFEPRFMAIRRFLFVTEGSMHTVDLDCSIPLNLDMTVKFANAPLHQEPDFTQLLTFLNIGPEGVYGGYQWTVGESSTDTVLLEDQAPLTGPLTGMSYFIYGGAFTSTSQFTSQTPYSIDQMDQVTDFSQTIQLGPLPTIPQMISPIAGVPLTTNHFEWSMQSVVDVYDAQILEPSFPAPILRWQAWIPGTANSFDIPTLLPNTGAADPYTGQAFFVLDAIDIEGPFDFDQFSLDDLRFRRQAASTRIDQITIQ